jgi:hypothetical protein
MAPLLLCIEELFFSQDRFADLPGVQIAALRYRATQLRAQPVVDVYIELAQLNPGGFGTLSYIRLQCEQLATDFPSFGC